MSKKIKEEQLSFTEDGQRWLQCKVCYDYIKVDEDAHAITCSACVMRKTLELKPMDTFFAKKHKKTGRPAGWHFMNEFVDKKGNVFHKGKEQPDLKGTLKPTKVKPPKKRKKLTKDEKLYKRISEYKKRKKARKKK